MEMVERVARAIASVSPLHENNWSRMSPVAKELVTIQARAAIEAMREPTEFMIQAGGISRVYPSVYMGGAPEAAKRDALRIYDAMIRNALAEPEVGRMANNTEEK